MHQNSQLYGNDHSWLGLEKYATKQREAEIAMHETQFNYCADYDGDRRKEKKEHPFSHIQYMHCTFGMAVISSSSTSSRGFGLASTPASVATFDRTKPISWAILLYNTAG